MTDYEIMLGIWEREGRKVTIVEKKKTTFFLKATLEKNILGKNRKLCAYAIFDKNGNSIGSCIDKETAIAIWKNVKR